jgi:single-strand DNA-binding protein
MNKIILIGNLGRDPEMSYTPSGVAFTRFTLAVNRYTKGAEGEPRKKETDWFNVVAWRQLAETCNSYLRKGSKVYIEGRLSQREYVAKDGSNRTSIEVVTNEMEMLDRKPSQGGSAEPFASDDDPLGELEDHPF